MFFSISKSLALVIAQMLLNNYRFFTGKKLLLFTPQLKGDVCKVTPPSHAPFKCALHNGIFLLDGLGASSFSISDFISFARIVNCSCVLYRKLSNLAIY